MLTRGAVSAGPGENVEDLGAAAVWGLLRSAQAEHPDRFLLVDHDGHQDSGAVLAAAVAAGHPHLALRRGRALTPRLAPLTPSAATPAPGDGTPWRMDVTGQGTLENLAAVPCPEAAGVLGAGQVRVVMHGAGVELPGRRGRPRHDPWARTSSAARAPGVVLDIRAGCVRPDAR
ncbi:hypothetical protein SANTM175S_05213 [Streptomyces antimycoticus]